MQTDVSISPEQMLYLSHRMLGATKGQAAASADATVEEVDSWELQPAFRKEMGEVYTKYVEIAKARLQDILTKGITRLDELLDATNPDGSPNDAIREKAVRIALTPSGILNPPKPEREVVTNTIQIVLDNGDL